MLRTRGVNAESVLHAELPQQSPEAVPGGTQDRAFSLCGQGSTNIDYLFVFISVYFFLAHCVLITY